MSTSREYYATLKHSGLNLIAVFELKQLPSELLAPVSGSGVDINRFSKLMLLGHAGRWLWEAMKEAEVDFEGSEPVDFFSIGVVERFLTDYVNLKPNQYRFLYPFTTADTHPRPENYAPALLIPLQKLGRLANWGRPSPIGNSIHPTYGLWTAFRAAVLVDADLPLQTEPAAPSPCDSCIEKPCITACPAGAVGEIGAFGLAACATHRSAAGSSCATQCLARLACPIGAEHRYSAKQLRYHYLHSLPAMRAYANSLK